MLRVAVRRAEFFRETGRGRRIRIRPGPRNISRLSFPPSREYSDSRDIVVVLCRLRSGVPSFADLTVRRVDCLSGRSFAGQILGMFTWRVDVGLRLILE